MKKLRFRHIWLILMIFLTIIYYIFAENRRIMNAVVNVTLPVRQSIARACSHFSFSIAETVCTIGVLLVLAWLVWTVVSVCRKKPRLLIFWKRLSLLLAAVMTVSLFLCIMLGATFKADSFQDRSGLRAEPETVDALYAVTERFTEKLCKTADSVPRDADGQFCVTREAIFADATKIYRGAENVFPFLTLEDVAPKGAMYSHLMSICGWTGFYFPFSGEAHVNIEPPNALLPSTIAHEMAHQRGVAAELEANFVAILACAESGNPVYEYSGWLFGFLHLGNALYDHDPERYYELAGRLPETVWADLRANDEFWAENETKAAEVTEQLYDSMLKGYGHELGLQSYGAVVDLLIAWDKRGGFGD